MSIRIRAALWFSSLVLIVLLGTSYAIYIQYAVYRQKSFHHRLDNRAKFAMRFAKDSTDESIMIRRMSRDSAWVLPEETAYLYDANYKQLVNLNPNSPLKIDNNFLDEVNREGQAFMVQNQFEIAGLRLKDSLGNIYLGVAGAVDVTGKAKLESLRLFIFISILVSLFITGILAYWVTGIILKPVTELSRQVRGITLSNLNRNPVPADAGRDEIGQLKEDFYEMLNRLRSAADKQKVFIQYASHEMRTPLTILSAQIENALEKEPKNSPAYHTFESLHEETHNLTELVNNLLTLSKVENPENTSIDEEIRVDELLDICVREVLSIHPDWSVSIDFEEMPESEEFLKIRANSVLLSAGFRNLILNGCEYSSRHSVVILISKKQDKLRIVFRNNGTVPSAEVQKKLFVPFWRGENVNHTKGNGLGLAITKGIIELHKGYIWFANPGPDIIDFVVELPLQASTA